MGYDGPPNIATLRIPPRGELNYNKQQTEYTHMKITLPAITPGEWISHGDGDMVYQLNEDGTNRFSLWQHGGYIRQSKRGDGIKIKTSEEEVAANTQAIAALPELLEAIKSTLESLAGEIADQLTGDECSQLGIYDIINTLQNSLERAGATIED